MKRISIMFLVAMLTFSSINLNVSATVTKNNPDYVEKLNKVGMFKGSDVGLELDRESTRLEGLVMMIRLIGKEDEALSMLSTETVFDDVPEWGMKYVKYAYDNGLTNGVSALKFGSDLSIDANTYTTFVLRALGYDDNKGDFKWSEATDKGVDIGLIDRSRKSALKKFTRDDVAEISYNALQTETKHADKFLVEELVNSGDFNNADVEILELRESVADSISYVVTASSNKNSDDEVEAKAKAASKSVESSSNNITREEAVEAEKAVDPQTMSNYIINNGAFLSDSDGDGMADGWNKPSDARTSLSKGIQTITYNTADQTSRYSLKGTAINTTGKDQYFLSMWVKTTAPDVRFYVSKKSTGGSTYPRVVLEDQNGEWQYYSMLIDMSDDATSYLESIAIKDAQAEGSAVYVSNVSLFNLTEDYGIGNEPTKAVIDALMEAKVPETVVVAEKPVVKEPVAEEPVVVESVERPVEESVNVEGYLNVKDYGAKGDGVTDDTAAFAAALKDGNIIIPEGLFIVHKLKVPSNRQIIGVDREKSRLRINYKVAKDHDAVMDIYSKENITMKNFTFDMKPPWTFDSDAWKGQKCAYIRGGRNIRVENVDAINNEHGVFYIGADGDRRGDGLYFINCRFINVDTAINSDRNMKYQGDDNVYIIGCYFEGHYLSEPVFLDDSTNVVVRDCVSKNKWGGSAWRFDTCSDVLIDNCVSDTMGNGAYFDDSRDNIVVQNSTFTNSRWANIQSNNSSVTRINNTFY